MKKRLLPLDNFELNALRTGTLSRLIRQPVTLAGDPSDTLFLKQPFGKSGDLLYVQELWRVTAWDPEDMTVTLQYADTTRREVDLSLRGDGEGIFDTLAMESSDDYEQAGIQQDTDGWYRTDGPIPTRWRAASTMRKWAARRILRVDFVEAKLLRDLTETEVLAAGVQPIVTRLSEAPTYSAYFNAMLGNNGRPWVVDSAVESYAQQAFITRPDQDQDNVSRSLEERLQAFNPLVWTTKVQVIDPPQ